MLLKIFTRAVLAIPFFLIDGNPSLAQFSPSQRQELIEAIYSAIDELDSKAIPDRSQCAAEFLSEIKRVDQYLSSPTCKIDNTGWHQYLQLKELQQAIESDDKQEMQILLAMASRHRMVGPVPGVELPELVKFRRALGCYLSSLRLTPPEVEIEEIKQRLVELSRRLTLMAAIHPTDESIEIARDVALLSELHQSPAGVLRIKNIFSQPNMVITLSEPFVQKVVHRTVNDRKPIDDCILGTHMVGNASIQGDITADLRPSHGTAQLDILLNARVNSINRGYHSPVVINAVGNANIHARRSLNLSEQGVTFQPASVTTSFSSEIKSIEHPLRLVRRIASRRAAQQKPASDCIAKQRLTKQVTDQFIAETNTAGTLAPDDPLTGLRPWLGRFDIADPERSWSSTEHSLVIQGRVAGIDQLNSPNANPAINSAFQVAIQVHETCVSNSLSSFLSDRTLNRTELAPLLWMVGKKQLLPLPIEVNKISVDHVSITFTQPELGFDFTLSHFVPIVFEARNNRVEIGFRGTRFTQGESKFVHAIEVRGAYTPQVNVKGYFHLVKSGPVAVILPERSHMIDDDQAMTNQVQQAFEPLYPDILMDQEFIVPADIPVETLRNLSLRPSLISAQDGWLTIAVQ